MLCIFRGHAQCVASPFYVCFGIVQCASLFISSPCEGLIEVSFYPHGLSLFKFWSAFLTSLDYLCLNFFHAPTGPMVILEVALATLWYKLYVCAIYFRYKGTFPKPLHQKNNELGFLVQRCQRCQECIHVSGPCLLLNQPMVLWLHFAMFNTPTLIGLPFSINTTPFLLPFIVLTLLQPPIFSLPFLVFLFLSLACHLGLKIVGSKSLPLCVGSKSFLLCVIVSYYAYYYFLV